MTSRDARALGARRETVMLLMFVETMLLTLLGGVAGWLIGHGLLAVANHWVTPLTGISINTLEFFRVRSRIDSGFDFALGHCRVLARNDGV